MRLLFCALALYFTGANSENSYETKFFELENKLNDFKKSNIHTLLKAEKQRH